MESLLSPPAHFFIPPGGDIFNLSVSIFEKFSSILQQPILAPSMAGLLSFFSFSFFLFLFFLFLLYLFFLFFFFLSLSFLSLSLFSFDCLSNSSLSLLDNCHLLILFLHFPLFLFLFLSGFFSSFTTSLYLFLNRLTAFFFFLFLGSTFSSLSLKIYSPISYLPLQLVGCLGLGYLYSQEYLLWIYAFFCGTYISFARIILSIGKEYYIYFSSGFLNTSLYFYIRNFISFMAFWPLFSSCCICAAFF